MGQQPEFLLVLNPLHFWLKRKGVSKGKKKNERKKKGSEETKKS